jgi:transcription elongation factor GreA
MMPGSSELQPPRTDPGSGEFGGSSPAPAAGVDALPPAVDGGDEGALAPLREAVAEGDYERIEDLWIEAVSDAERSTERFEDLLGLAEGLCKRLDTEPRRRQRLGALVELLSSALSAETPNPLALRLYWLLVRLVPQRKEHAVGFSERFEAQYPVASAERAFYQASAFPSSAEPAAALERLEKLLKFREGAWVVHGSGWGVGRVVAVDPFLQQIKVDLENKSGHRIAINVIDSILRPLDPQSFIVLRHAKSPELERLREEDPARLLELVMESCGSRMTVRELRAQLVPQVVSAGSWAKWWSRAKTELRRSGFFRVADRAPFLIEKVESAVSYADDLVEQFHKAEWPIARKIARQVSRRKRGDLGDAWRRMRERLLQLAGGPSPATAVEASLILDRGEAEGSGEHFEATVKRFSLRELCAALQEIPGGEDLRRAVQALPACLPGDWEEATLALFHGKSDALRDLALELLEERSAERARAVVSEVLRGPQSSPDAFCFLLRARLGGRDRSSLEAFRLLSERSLLATLLDLLDHLRHRSQREGYMALKDVLLKVYEILETDHCGFFSRSVGAMEPEEQREVQARIHESQVLPQELRASLLVALVKVAPELAEAAQAPPWEDDGVIYVTAEGLERKRDEYREITDVKLPENFKAIGRAREFGDLSENAEYTSALEERDRLTHRATQMKQDLDKARILGPEFVKDDVAGLGSRVRVVRLETGEEATYSVLGPWDADPEHGVVSYRSPLGRALLGHRVGEEVVAELPAGRERYRITAITSCFAKGS